MTIQPALQQLLSALPEGDQLSFFALLEALHTVRYSGVVTLHCQNGVPRQVDLGAPLRLSIMEGISQSLDKPLALPPDSSST